MGMSETPKGKDQDQAKGDEILRRMLKTPPDPGRKSRASEMDQKQKPGGRPVKKDHPEEGR